MKQQGRWSVLLVLMAVLTAGGGAADASADAARPGPVRVYGTIWKVQGSLASVKTAQGELTFSSGLDGLRVGEEVEVLVTDQAVIEVTPLGRGTTAPAPASLLSGAALLLQQSETSREPGLTF
ncbi:hypothetical protein [Candidatus Nitrospira bockiana]